jgi:voltage-gated potassium channel
MNKINFGTTALWNAILVIVVMFAAFILPIMPVVWHRASFRAVYSLIYISAIFSLDKRSNYLLILFISTLLLEWLSGMLNMPVIQVISKGVNILFFLVIVFSLIRQIATSREVTAVVILSSVAGYLLLGIVYSIFIAYIGQHDPGAFNATIMDASNTDSGINTSMPLYFSFVTMASLGYGDIVPLKPYTRSLAIWMAVSGQFYIAIIVALLVGKFSSKQPRNKNN